MTVPVLPDNSSIGTSASLVSNQMQKEELGFEAEEFETERISSSEEGSGLIDGLHLEEI